MTYAAEEARGDPLLVVNVDRAKVGANWPRGIAQIIEAHEKGCGYLATRKVIHVLIDRYVEAYFPDVEIGYEDRRYIIGLLRSRYYQRSSLFFARIMERKVRNLGALSGDSADVNER
jgi:hypothetical protein